MCVLKPEDYRFQGPEGSIVVPKKVIRVDIPYLREMETGEASIVLAMLVVQSFYEWQRNSSFLKAGDKSVAVDLIDALNLTRRGLSRPSVEGLSGSWAWNDLHIHEDRALRAILSVMTYWATFAEEVEQYNVVFVITFAYVSSDRCIRAFALSPYQLLPHRLHFRWVDCSVPQSSITLCSVRPCAEPWDKRATETRPDH